jgi:dihydroorotase
VTVSGEDWLIRGGRVIDPATATDEALDVGIHDGRIARIGRRLRARGGHVFDATGCIVAPGLVDMHVHLREPGHTHKETIATGTLAAAAGGFTAVACMPNTEPPLDTPEMILHVRRLAETEAHADVYPVACITRGRRGQEPADWAALRDAGTVAFSDDGSSVPDVDIMRAVLRASAADGFSVLVHCEDPVLARDGVMHLGAASRALGLPGLSPLAEERIVARDILTAEEMHGRLHILHMSTARGVELVRQAKQRGARVTAEACPHHCILTDESVREHGANAKMNPPLRSAADVSGVLAGLSDGTLDVIATDHAPHTAEEKGKGMLEAPFGVIGLELCVPLLWTYLVEGRRFPPAALLEKLTAAPARVLGVRTPTLATGARADVAVLDPVLELEATADRLFSKSANTPVLGRRLRGWPVLTLRRGRQTFLRAEAAARRQP